MSFLLFFFSFFFSSRRRHTRCALVTGVQTCALPICPLDAHGIAVIDYQNNGSPGAFAALARALNYPWAMICDGDQGGNDHIDQLRSHNFTEAEIPDLVTQLPARSEEHTSELQSLMRISYAVFGLNKNNKLTSTIQ